MRFDERFTESAKTALTLAQEAAAELGHGYVGCEHLLLGMLREELTMALSRAARGKGDPPRKPRGERR